MAEEKDLIQAQKTFDTLCRALDNHNLKYRKNPERLTIDCGAQGDDLPMDVNISVDADVMLIILLSQLPFVVQEDKRIDVAVAVSAVNNLIVDGSFDYDLRSGRMVFRMTSSFLESSVGEDVFSYMLLCSFKTIDDFNDKFLMIAKGMLPLEKFLEDLNK
ncbi:MAG: YbjN domain-containing protein [Eubacterium sp.]|nr:YbjN domain-containing protein [Eubacterium sp.]